MKLSDQLSLSVVSHGQGHLVERLVSQLDEILELKGVKLIVTLNVPGESFRYEAILPKRLQLQVLRNVAPLGFGANHNQAFAQCLTPWFGVLNPDLQIPQDIFSPLLKIGAAEGAALLAPLVIDPVANREDSVRANLTPWSLVKRHLLGSSDVRPQHGQFQWFAGMFYLIRSEAYREVCGFDTHYFLYCEDYDFCARLHLSDHLLRYVPEVQVLHDSQRSSWRSLRYLKMHLASLIRVWTSYPVWRIALRSVFRSKGSQPY